MSKYYTKRITVRKHDQTYYVNDGKGGKRPVKRDKDPYPRDQRYRDYKTLSREEAIRKFNQKSIRAKAIDRSKTSKKVFDEPNEFWLEHMGRSDVKDIDTSQKELQTEMKIIYQLEQVGGNHWEKYGKNRIYFDAGELAKMMGYDWDYYKTGNISSATLDGEHISNSEMKRVLNDLNSKIYYDVDDKKFNYLTGIGTGQEHTQKAIKKLKKKIVKIEKK